LNKFMH